MSEPIDRFCSVIAALPKSEQSDAIFQCLIAIGQPAEPVNVSIQSIPKLRGRLQELSGFGVSEEFVITSIFSFLIRRFSDTSSEESIQKSIELHTAVLARLTAQLETPMDDRASQVNDGQLRKFIADSERHIEDARSRAESAGRIATHLESEQAKKFTPDYWYRCRTGQPPAEGS